MRKHTLLLALGTILIAFTCVAHAGLQDGLVGYYPLDGNANDISGNYNHGVEYGGITYRDGLFGQSAEFDGVDDYISVSYLDYLQSITSKDKSVSMWFKPSLPCTCTPDDRDMLLSMGKEFQVVVKSDQCSGLASWFSQDYSGEPDPGLHCINSYFGAFDPAGWNHIVSTFNDEGNGTLSLYINGSLVTTNLAPGQTNPATASTLGANFSQCTRLAPDSELLFGRRATNCDEGFLFKGLIDEIRLYDRVLSQTEVQELYVKTPNRSPVLHSIGNKVGQEGELLEFVITAEDPDGDALTYSASNLPAGATFNSATRTFSWTPDYNQQGNYQDIEFTVVDSGNPIELDTELITITIGNINRVPEFEPVGMKTVQEGEVLLFTVRASDPDVGDTVTLDVEDLPINATFDEINGQFSWEPSYLQQGKYIITFLAIDNGTPVGTALIQVSITVGNTPNPILLIDELINDIEKNINLSQSIKNKYLANLKKVGTFIQKGKIRPAVNQIYAFSCKVSEDRSTDVIDSETAGDFLYRAEQVIIDLDNDPQGYDCAGSHL